jgi:hypothetical protein
LHMFIMSFRTLYRTIRVSRRHQQPSSSRGVRVVPMG